MSLEEKKAWSFLLVAVLAYGVYLTLIGTVGRGEQSAEIDYAPFMLWTIGGAVVTGVAANITLAITAPREARQSDQRDREIARLGEHVGQAFIVLGGISALALAILRADYFWVANAVYLGFVLSAVVGSIARLVAYRRGVPTW
jgi:hypothetical protein